MGRSRSDTNFHDEFEKPPSGPSGVHRGNRGVGRAIRPYIITCIIACLLGIAAWFFILGPGTGVFRQTLPSFSQSSSQPSSQSSGQGSSQSSGGASSYGTNTDQSTSAEDSGSSSTASADASSSRAKRDSLTFESAFIYRIRKGGSRGFLFGFRNSNTFYLI